MGDVIIVGVILSVLVFVTIVVLFKPEEQPAEKGSWSIAELNNDQVTDICLIRYDGNRRTGRIVVATIPDDAPDWTYRYEEGMAQARERLVSLQAKH